MNVYQGGVIDWQHSKEPHHGQCRAIIAAKSWKAAHKIVSARFPTITLGHMKNYWTITRNQKQIAAAMPHPNKLMLSSSLTWDDDYKVVETK